MDKEACFACVFCDFMTMSKEDLEQHITTKHHGMLLNYDRKDILSEPHNKCLKQTSELINSIQGNDMSEGSSSSKEQTALDCELPLNPGKIDNCWTGEFRDTKPCFSSLPYELSKSDANKSVCVKPDPAVTERSENISTGTSKDIMKQEIPSHSPSICGVKEEIMYCNHCPYNDVDFERLKFHIFTEHPTGATVVANSFDEATNNLHGIKLFCIKETCTFSTNLCNIYEEHLMSCCLLCQSFPEDEKERLNSTVSFILDFHKKHSLSPVLGFLDYVSTFNTIFKYKHDKHQIIKKVENANSSSILTGSESTLDVSPVIGGNIGTYFENSSSSFPAPALLFSAQNTDFNSRSTFCKIDIHNEHALLSSEEQERNDERSIKAVPFDKKFSLTNEGETTEGTLYTTGDVDDVTKNISLARDIAKSHTEEKPFKCNECGKSFCQNSSLIRHMAIHTGDNPLKCIECGKTFKWNNSFVLHMRTHTDEKPFKCNECGKSFLDKGYLMKHIRIHSGDKRFKCSECGKTFLDKSCLIKHMRTHSGDRPFECDQCGMAFKWNYALSRHKVTHTGEEPFKCDKCGKTFKWNKSLIRHMKAHAGEKPYKCNECGRTFLDKGTLRKHGTTHKVDKPFECSECGKTFKWNESIILHMRTHTGEKPFKCDECGKAFGDNSCLIKHSRIHKIDKPFKCDECGKTFKWNESLILHMRTHTGEKPFKCNECGKTFKWNESIIKHMKTHT